MDTVTLEKFIRDVPDFPKKGIMFKDITPLLRDKTAFKTAVARMAKPFAHTPVDAVVGVEARGFIFGAAVASVLGVGFIPVRKKGKLPYKTKSVTYALEYGTDTLEMHDDAVQKGARIVLVDDLLATGGTLAAVTQLLQQKQAQIVGISFLIELTFLNGREKLKGFPLHTLIQY